VLRRIVAHLMAPSLLAALLYVALRSFREYAASIFLTAPGTQVFSVLVLDMWDTGSFNRLSAYVIPVPDREPPRPAALRRVVRARGVAAYKVPDTVKVVDAFPATGVGKTSRRALRAALADHARRPTPGAPAPDPDEESPA